MSTVVIPLTQGKVALIDEEDLPLVEGRSWFVARRRWTCYAQSSMMWRGTLTCVLMHRYLLDAPPGMEVDHRNHDGLDNRRANIRPATSTQNSGNIRKYKNNTSGYKGVFWVRKRGLWLAQLRCEGRQHYLGCFALPEDAARAYDCKAREVFGEFASLNFPD